LCSAPRFVRRIVGTDKDKPRCARHDHRIDDRTFIQPALRPRRSKIRVVVGHDEPLYREGITYVLRRAGLDVVAAATDHDGLKRKLRAYRPDVAVFDIDMPPSRSVGDRVLAARSLCASDSGVAVLILSQVPDYALTILGERTEGIGYLLKNRIADAEQFTEAVRRVARGGIAIDPLVVTLLAGRARTRDPFEGLTSRERQVLALMAQGLSNRSIAGELVVSTPAVERHVTSIFAKLGMSSRRRDVHRRVMAVVRYLGQSSSPASRMVLVDSQKRDAIRAAPSPGAGRVARSA
jgi:DNA-binding NarL/FixJ family response regulator